MSKKLHIDYNKYIEQYVCYELGELDSSGKEKKYSVEHLSNLNSVFTYVKNKYERKRKIKIIIEDCNNADCSELEKKLSKILPKSIIQKID